MSAIVVKEKLNELSSLDQEALLAVLQKAYQAGEFEETDSKKLIENIKRMLVDSCAVKEKV